MEQGVDPKDFNSYGARRGNDRIMTRGTFANIRLRNLTAPGTEGPWTTYWPSNEKMFIYDAAMKYKETHTPLDRPGRQRIRHRFFPRLGSQRHHLAWHPGGHR